MNIPIKIHNQKPWIKLDSFKNIFFDNIDFSSYQTCISEDDPSTYIARPHIRNLVKILKDTNPEKEEYYFDVLNVYFDKIDEVLKGLIDLLLLNNPVNILNPTRLDSILQDSINRVINPDSDLWDDQLIKNQLTGLLEDSFLDYELRYDPSSKGGKCVILFRYLPEGTQRSILLHLHPTTQPDQITEGCTPLWGTEFISEMKELSQKEWLSRFGEKNSPNYSRCLYESVMSERGGVEIQEFFVDSYRKTKKQDAIYTKDFESMTGFTDFSEIELGTLPYNILLHVLKGTFDLHTINSGFTYGTQGWNVVNELSNITSSVNSVDTGYHFIDSNGSVNENTELVIDYRSTSLNQINRIPPGKYELKLSLRTTVPREFKIYFGEVETTFNLNPTSNFQTVTLTDIGNSGMEITDPSNINYGFVCKEVTTEPDRTNCKTYIEFCILNKI